MSEGKWMDAELRLTWITHDYFGASLPQNSGEAEKKVKLC